MPTSAEILARAVALLGGAPRAGQERMAQAAQQALQEGTVLLAQAGTGTGKSLAYLAAAGALAAEGRRTVVSTATLALQRQVLTKDAPLVAQAVEELTGTTPEIAVLKGWQNYACRHRLAGGYEEEPTLFDDARATELEKQVARVRRWAEESQTGDRDEATVSDRVWRLVSVSKLACLGGKCPMHAQCFAVAARERAADADIVVTNHALLGLVAAGNPGVLPEYDALVVDEAHDLVSRVTSAATVELTPSGVERAARRAAGEGEKLAQAGRALSDALAQVLSGRLRRLPPELAAALTTVRTEARDTLSRLPAASDDGKVAQARAEILEVFEVCERALSGSVEALTDVAWVRHGDDGTSSLSLAPLDVSGAIGQNVVAGHGVVATSATLTLGGSFAPAAAALGVDKWDGEDFGSPFTYPEQGIVYVAAHLPPPGREGVSEDALAELVDLIDAAGGGTLGLFSSRRGAERAALFARERLDTPVLLQGEEPIVELVGRFRDDPSASLFGTLTLWQGVDVAGFTSRLVVVDRIPFPRPDDPLHQARTEAAERAGRRGFEISLQHAALLLAQGAGRLIRTDTDRGVVAVLDSRLARARYAGYLMRSIPPLWPTTDPDVVRAALRRLQRA